MQIRLLATALIAAAFALTALASPAAAQSDAPRASVKKYQAKKRIVRESQSGGQIACTAFGCGPIPRNCRPTPGMRWNGDPSGYDVIVCR